MRKSLLILSLAALSFVFACQKTQVAEYRKYKDDADVPRMAVADAKREFGAGTAIIVDSRAEAAYKLEHIAGSINIPIGTPEEKFNDLPRDKKIIVYCS